MKKWWVLIWLVGCKVSSFNTLVVPTLDMDAFHTYMLVPYTNQVNITQPEYDNPENRALIDKAIRDELEALGLTPVDQNPDLRITYNLLIRDRVDTRVDSAVVYKPWVDTRYDYFNYTEGAFTLIFINHQTGEIVAQSQVQSVMDRNPKKFRTAIPRMIKLMVKKIQEKAHDS